MHSFFRRNIDTLKPTIESLLNKWDTNLWEYIISNIGEDGGFEFSVKLGVLPKGHSKAKFVVCKGLDLIDAMNLADFQAQNLLESHK